MHSTALHTPHSTSLHYPALHSTLHTALHYLHCTEQCSTALHRTMQYSTAETSAVQHCSEKCTICTAQNSAVQHCTEQCSTALHRTVQYSTAENSAVQQCSMTIDHNWTISRRLRHIYRDEKLSVCFHTYQYSTVQCSVLHRTVLQCGAVQCVMHCSSSHKPGDA